MLNKSYFYFLLITLLFFIPGYSKAMDNSFIPGINELGYDTYSFKPFTIETCYFRNLDKAELIKNFGPNKEEALKLTINRKGGSVVAVRYSLELEKYSKYEITVEYKADYKTDKGADYGAAIIVRPHNPTTGFQPPEYIIKPLKNNKKWTKAKIVFDYIESPFSTPDVLFTLGMEEPDLIFSTGNLYFINFKIEKKEGLEK